MVLAGEQRLSFQHLGENTACTPDVDFHVIFLPCKHDFRGSVVSRRNIAGHLGVLDTSKAKIANFQIAVFVDKDVAGFEVAVNDAC